MRWQNQNILRKYFYNIINTKVPGIPFAHFQEEMNIDELEEE